MGRAMSLAAERVTEERHTPLLPRHVHPPVEIRRGVGDDLADRGQSVGVASADRGVSVGDGLPGCQREQRDREGRAHDSLIG